MNVLLDGSPLYSNRSGVYRYTAKLYEHLSALGVHVKFLQNPVFFRKRPPVPDWPENAMLDRYYPYKAIRRFMKPNPLYRVPLDLFAPGSIDIVHGTNFVHFPALKAGTVVTIHDLAYMRYPEVTTEQIYRHHMKWVPYSARVCDRIIADSMQTKEDIVELLSVPEDKIDVVHLAADGQFRPLPPDEAKTVTDLYGLSDGYFLAVGTVEPRKNLITLLRAYKRLLDAGCREPRLVIVGPKGWKYNPIMEYIKEHGLEERVVFTGYVPDERLPALYNRARALVYPSIYEGFGLPLVEAMSCGIPVIASNLSSIPEIVGDAGLLFPPTDAEQLAGLMKDIWNDHGLHGQYAQKALERSRRFSWERTARETLEVYHKALERK